MKLALLVLLTLAVYAPVASHPLVYEDDNWQAALTVPVQWTLPSRALSMTSLQWTPQSREAHLGNLALHLANGAAVYGIAQALAGSVAAPVAAFLFLLHPSNSQAVAYVAARTDLLMTLGALIAVGGILWRGWAGWLATLAGLLIALTSKEVGVLAIPLLLLTMLAWRRPTTWLMSGVVFVCGVMLGSAAPRLVSLITLAEGAGGSPLGFAGFVQVQAAAIWALLLQVVTLRGFTIDHDPLVTAHWLQVAAVALSIAVVIGAAALWRSSRLLAWCLGTLAITLAPRLLTPTAEYAAEQHLYLAMVPITIALGMAWAALSVYMEDRWLST